jgi:ABC-2 type transport system permease protein
VILAAYVGSFLMAGAFLAIGACISATTRNQVIAFVITVVVCFVFMLPGMPAVIGAFSGWAPAAVTDAIASLSFMTHFSSLSRGVIDLRAVVYFTLVIGFWLAANAVVLDVKKAD